MTRLRLSLSLLLLSGSATACEIIAGIQELKENDGTDTGVPSGSASTSTYGGGSTSGSTSGSSSSGSGEPTTDAAADARATSDGAIDGAGEASSAGDASDAGASDATLGDAQGDGSLQDVTIGGDADATATPEASTDAAGRDAAPEAAPPPPTTELIDDLESNSGHIIVVHGRTGSWFTYNDEPDGGPGVQTPPAGSRFLPTNAAPQLPGSIYAARTNGSGFAAFVGMGFTLNDPPAGVDAGVKSPYDASAYVGVAFYARAASGTAARVRVNIPDIDTDAQGHICTACADYYGEEFALTSTWTQYFAYFSDLQTQNFGAPPTTALAVQAIYGVSFQINAGGTNPSPLVFDLWVDNVSFITP